MFGTGQVQRVLHLSGRDKDWTWRALVGPGLVLRHGLWRGQGRQGRQGWTGVDLGWHEDGGHVVDVVQVDALVLTRSNVAALVVVLGLDLGHGHGRRDYVAHWCPDRRGGGIGQLHHNQQG